MKGQYISMSSSPEVFTPPPHSDLEVSASGQHQVTMQDKFYADQPPQSAIPPNYYYTSPEQDARKERTICGVRPATFFLSLALVVVILVAAIGGGVGGTMAVNNAKSANVANSNAAVCTSTVFSTASPTPTSSGASTSATASGTSRPSSSSTSSSVIVVPTAGTVALDCPRIDGTQIQMNVGNVSTFNLVCGRDYPGAKNDIVALTVYSVDDCARACASMNRNSRSNICKGAAYKSDLTLNVPVNFGNCWLKNTTSTPSDTKDKNDLVALLLQ